MRKQSPTIGIATINGTPASGSENQQGAILVSFTLSSESNPNEWFYDAAQDLLGKDAGLHLHKITGYPESSCYAYTAQNAEKRRRPPEHFLRKLFADADVGESFHARFMATVNAVWWIEHLRTHGVGAAAIAAMRGTG